jgi:2-methylcitrate dehydratase PrpD
MVRRRCWAPRPRDRDCGRSTRLIQAVRSVRIAATLVLTSSYNNAVAGATTLNVAGGMSGFVLGLAPDLALAGFTAQDDAIEEALSGLVGDGFQPAGLLDQLGTRWEITRNWFRLRACCNPIYAALDALEEAIAALHAKAEDIERIDIATFRFATVMCNPDPPNYFASKYSLPHVAACLAVRGSAGYESVDDSALDDPAITALRHRVHVREDPAMNSAVPALKPARVTLTLKDGQQITRACDSPRGDCLNPYDESEIRLKFRQLAGFALTARGLGEVERAVDGFEHWTSVTELTDVLRRHGRPDWSRAPSANLRRCRRFREYPKFPGRDRGGWLTSQS